MKLSVTAFMLFFLKGNSTMFTSGHKGSCLNVPPDQPRILRGKEHIEAVLDESLTLSCLVCSLRDDSIAVAWEKEGLPVIESQDLRSYRRNREEFVLRVQRMKEIYLGNYTCVLLVDRKQELDRQRFHVSLQPAPPTWEPEPDRVHRHAQLLRWSADSNFNIINYILDFRLKPASGLGEDWLSIVVPFQNGSQVYNLRGLNEGTEYEARVRSRTRLGVSPFSSIFTFSTFTEFREEPTRFSMSREDTTGQLSLFRSCAAVQAVTQVLQLLAILQFII